LTDISADVAVIGAGPGGCSAAVQCTRLGLDTVIADSAGIAGGLVLEARSIENYPGTETPIGGEVFALRLREMLNRFGLSVRNLHVERVSMDDGMFRSEGTEGILTSRCLIVATGTVPADFALPSRGNPRMYRSIIPLRMDPPARAVVIGGGEAAADYSLSLSDLGTDVILLVRGDRLRAAGMLRSQLLERGSIRIMYNTVPEFAESGQGSAVLRTCSPLGQAELETDAILAAVGREPSLPGIMPDGFHWIEGTAVTSIPGLFLVGDAALGRLGQTGIAVGHGLMAAGMAADLVTGVDR